MRRSVQVGVLLAALGLTASACSVVSAGVDIASAQSQFCSDVRQYITTLDDYGGIFRQQGATVGDVVTAHAGLASARQAVEESADEFRAAVAEGSAAGVDIQILDPASLQRVVRAEAAFAAAEAVVDATTPLADAGVLFTSAAYQLEVAWLLLFADAGCVSDEAAANQWVANYTAALQSDLRAAGYYAGPIDGIYGPGTVAGVEQLQEDAGLPVTGLVDPATQVALTVAIGQQESAEIGALQGILTVTGYYDGPIDGQWSAQVESSLEDLQTDLGVPATGVVDAATIHAFREALNEEEELPDTTTTTTTVPVTTTTRAPVVTTTVPETTTTTTVPAPADGILEVLAQSGQFTELLAAIDAAGLTEMLSGPGPFTLFAPTDEAFSQLPGGVPTDPAVLQALILHHVVEQGLTAFKLVEQGTVESAGGQPLVITQTVDGFIVVDGIATITISNVAGSNGYAHAVDTVILR